MFDISLFDLLTFGAATAAAMWARRASQACEETGGRSECARAERGLVGARATVAVETAGLVQNVERLAKNVAANLTEHGKRHGELLERLDEAATTIADRVVPEIGSQVTKGSEAVATRISELVAARVAEALCGVAAEQLAAAISKAVGPQVRRPTWKRTGKDAMSAGSRRSGSQGTSAATETPAPAQETGVGAERAETAGDAATEQGSEARRAAETTGDPGRGNEDARAARGSRRRWRQRARPGHRRRDRRACGSQRGQ